MTTKLPNEARILELERRLAAAEAELGAMKLFSAPSTPDQIVRLVRTVNPSEGSYPATGSVVPVSFLDAEHTGLTSDPTFTKRSASQQNVAASIDGSLPSVNTDHVAFRLARQWYLISGGSGGGGWQVLEIADDGGDPGDAENPCTYTYELVSDPTTYNGLEPSFPVRPPFGRMIPADKGIFDSDMNLIMVNEFIDVTTGT